jgi:hypothetical protein
MWLAWKRVQDDMSSAILGVDFDSTDRRGVGEQIEESREGLHDEVWASYKYAIVADGREDDGLKVIDIGAGHASAGGSLSARVVVALKTEGLLNESIGAGYIARNWPPTLRESGGWPLRGLRQAFLDGTLTRLLDPEEVLRGQVVKFVEKGEMGLASGPQPDGGYQRIWWKESIGQEEVLFEDKTFLLTKARAASGRIPQEAAPNATGSATETAPAEEFVLEPPPAGQEGTRGVSSWRLRCEETFRRSSGTGLEQS